MTLHPAARVAVGASAGLALACGSPTDPNTQRVVGTIDPGLSSAAVIDAPSEARSGVAFTVTSARSVARPAPRPMEARSR